MTSVLREIVIDCNQPQLVAAFWSQVLSWEVKREDDFLWMSESGEDDSAGAVLVFAPVRERKAVKNRVHIDVSPRGCEQAEELDRLLGLGARPVDIGQGDVPWEVLADPEGNEFCLLSGRVD